jgi:hypothetical protein
MASNLSMTVRTTAAIVLFLVWHSHGGSETVLSAVPADDLGFRFQSADFRRSRFGSVGRGLTDAEVVQITDLANAQGNPPWLLLGFPSTTYDLTVTVYLEPDVTNAVVHRGRVLTLSAHGPPSVPERSAWTLKETRPYAYIVAPGHRTGEMIDERDISWPFAVRGDIDDDTLIDLVEFIRSKPAIPVPEGAAFRNLGDAPIAGVTRVDDGFVVGLRTGEATGQRITITRGAGHWVITHFEMWIV